MRRPEPPPKLQPSRNTTIVTIGMDNDNSEEERKKSVVKKVKFNPEVSTSENVEAVDDEDSSMEKNAIKLLEESILNFKGSGGKAKRIREEGDEAAGRGRRIEDCVSYYEPYI